MQRNIAAPSVNQFCHLNAIMPSICIVVDLNLTFNHTKSLSVAMEMQQWLQFAVL
jgi:hypothetical protein